MVVILEFSVGFGVALLEIAFNVVALGVVLASRLDIGVVVASVVPVGAPVIAFADVLSIVFVILLVAALVSLFDEVLTLRGSSLTVSGTSTGVSFLSAVSVVFVIEGGTTSSVGVGATVLGKTGAVGVESFKCGAEAESSVDSVGFTTDVCALFSVRSDDRSVVSSALFTTSLSGRVGVPD